MNDKATGKPDGQETSLGPLLKMPNGGVAPRCQARNRAGTQCGRPARDGFRVCDKHGAGSRVREERGERKPAGRPVLHGLYSVRGAENIRERMLEVEAATVDLENSDRELTLLRAQLWFLVDQSDARREDVDALEVVMSDLRALRVVDPVEALAVQRALLEGNRLVSRLSSWTDRVVDGASGVIAALKVRAETRLKLSESRAVDAMVEYIHMVRAIVLDIVPHDQMDLFETRLRREILKVLPEGEQKYDRADA